MSTLADILINVPLDFPPKLDAPEIRAREELRDILKSTPVIVINEVAKYFFDVFWEEKDCLKDSDFPCVAPPFPLFWMEYRVPKMITGGKPPMTVPMEFGGQRVGFFWGMEERAADSLGWDLTSYMFVEDGDCAVGPLYSVRLETDSLGQPARPTGSFLPKDLHTKPDEAEIAHTTMFTLHYPAFLAICFMHCSNVQLEDHRPKDSHLRKHQKLYGRAPIVYKTLNITPMQNIIRSKGGPSCGLKQALHIMRGHFKQFDKKPLFGKHKGLWWWSSQLRGSLKHGYIKKNYEVHPPKKDQPEH